MAHLVFQFEFDVYGERLVILKASWNMKAIESRILQLVFCVDPVRLLKELVDLLQSLVSLEGVTNFNSVAEVAGNSLVFIFMFNLSFEYFNVD